MEKRDRPEGQSVSEKHYADFEPAQAPTVGPAGDIQIAMVGPAPPAPAWTAENAICARGPCRHFWHLVTTVGEGNPDGTWEHLGIAPPRQHSYTCLVNRGMETEFPDDVAFDCNLWDPLTPSELAARDERRQLYQIRQQSTTPLERIEDAIDDEDAEPEAPAEENAP